MHKNVSGLEDIRGTVELPYNLGEMLLGFLGNYVRALSFNAEKSETTISIDGRKFVVKIEREGREYSGYVSFAIKGRRIRLYYSSRKELVDTIIMIRTEFLGGDKKGGLEVSGKKVVDIGAYVGDTAIFFVLDGARHVYAIEPYPHFYNIGKKNVIANRMGSRITMINAAVGKSSSSARVDAAERNFAGKELKAKKNQKRISIMSLSEIVDKYKIRDGALKVDCEGHEYEILLDADRETLRRFSHMEIEYHYGYSNILKKLEGAGFSVTHQGATKRLNFGTRSIMVHGFMQAKRVGR